jgi:hypothetical protein
MALSPEYGWPEPDNSSLVKNGAQDIRALGDAIDTSVWNVGYGQAAKNKIINGDFSIWQRGTSFTTIGSVYTADRWLMTVSGATATVTREAFTPGTAPVAGYEGQFFLRSDITGADDNYRIETKIEDVRTLAGQTATASFWVKTNANKNLSVYFIQNFGSGGSSAVTVTPQTIAATTSWTRVSATFSIPSISGKTIGTSNFLQFVIQNPANETFTMDVWGVQVEYGSKATPFQTATGTIQGELAACQRYYYRPNSTGYGYFCSSANFNTVSALGTVNFPVVMRTAPSFAASAGNTFMIYELSTVYSGTSIASDGTTQQTGGISVAVASGLTGGRATNIRSNNTAAFLEYSAEL